jgi:hypothetical protein
MPARGRARPTARFIARAGRRQLILARTNGTDRPVGLLFSVSGATLHVRSIDDPSVADRRQIIFASSKRLDRLIGRSMKARHHRRNPSLRDRYTRTIHTVQTIIPDRHHLPDRAAVVGTDCNRGRCRWCKCELAVEVDRAQRPTHSPGGGEKKNRRGQKRRRRSTARAAPTRWARARGRRASPAVTG